MNLDSERIRQLNPLKDWLLKYGIETNKKGFARCPFHNEKTASFKVYSNDTFYCFGCGEHGDVITLVMKMEGIDFKEACKRLDGEISYSQQRKVDRIKRERNNRLKYFDKIKAEYWKAFENWKNNETVIELFKPANSSEAPCEEFLTALKHRGYFLHLLDSAENRQLKEVEYGRI